MRLFLISGSCYLIYVVGKCQKGQGISIGLTEAELTREE